MEKNHDIKTRKQFGQFDTAAWATEILFDAHFSHLTEKDLLWEPTCGYGHALAAVPENIPAFGTELDQHRADHARKHTGRNVVTGDCLTVELPKGISAVFGNPPFIYKIFKGLMDRCSEILGIGNKAGFIVPAYFFQTSNTALDLIGTRWSFNQEMLPRDLFHLNGDQNKLQYPLVFATFTRDNCPRIFGMRLYKEVAEIRVLPEDIQQMIGSRINGARSVWRETLTQIITEAGGRASLQEIYRRIEGKRPTENPHWKEQVRKVVQKSFVRVEPGIYELQKAA